MPSIQFACQEQIKDENEYDVEFLTWESDELAIFVKPMEASSYEYSFIMTKDEIVYLRDFLNSMIQLHQKG